MQTFDQALFGHLKAGRVTFEDAMHVASSPHDFKLLVQADGRKGTTMDDVANVERQRNGSAPTTPAPGAPVGAPSLTVS
jgi:twitching motility protein PilT